MAEQIEDVVVCLSNLHVATLIWGEVQTGVSQDLRLAHFVTYRTVCRRPVFGSLWVSLPAPSQQTQKEWCLACYACFYNRCSIPSSLWLTAHCKRECWNNPEKA